MKKSLTILPVIILAFNLAVFSQFANYPNPAASYARILGYSYETRTDAAGNQYGICIFPDGTEADAWAFLKGETGQSFSYCAKKGYHIEMKTIDHGSWTEECAVCAKTDINGKKKEILMTDLMEQNGEPLVTLSEKPAGNFIDEIKEDPNLKSAMALPTVFDWRSYNGHTYIGPVRDQGNCGSCYAFGANANAEGVYNYAMGLYDGNCTDLSESFIIWCLGRLPAYNGHFFGCDGADYTYSELHALMTDGVTYEADFPYTITDPGSCTHWTDPRISFNNWYRAPCSDITAIKTAIMTYGVVDAAVYVSTAFQRYSTGIFSDNQTSCGSNPCYYTSTNHAIALVGWGTEGGTEYWILRNSWGNSWGENGYMRIATKAARVACEVAYVTYTPATPGPPVATTMPATNIMMNSATLNGTVQGENLATTVSFEYGTTVAYGSTVSAIPATVTGNTPVSVYVNISMLSPLTTYHFRVKAVNAEGTAYGNDMSFTTSGECKEQYEPNNTAATAEQIQAGLPLNALISPSGDIDWFRFSSTSTQKNVKVELYDLPADYDLQLCNSSGKVLKTSQNRGNKAETIIYNSNKTSSYTTKIYGYNNTWDPYNCYMLKVTLSSSKFAEEDGKNQGLMPEENPVMIIYPNPVSGKVNISYSSDATGKVSINIYNVTGQRLTTTVAEANEGENTFKVDVSALKQGIYFLELSNNAERLFGKVIVE
jgi:C1A family cysteine protease